MAARRAWPTAKIAEHEIVDTNVNVKYPSVFGLTDRSVEEQVNNRIKELVELLMVERGYGREYLAEMVGDYQVALNDKGILSIRFENYSYFEKAAHGNTVVKSLTFNLENGEEYGLYQLFRIRSIYRLIISNRIKEDIKRRNIPLTTRFKRINDDQTYYLTNNSLVIYFETYEYTPGYIGIPEFHIPYTIVANVINEEGPLTRFK